MGNKYNPVNLLFVDAYNYNNKFENEAPFDSRRKSDKEDSDMSPLEGDKKESEMPRL